MFSVDNFYTFMQSSYGKHRTDAVLYKHVIDGSKNIQDLKPYHEPPPVHAKEFECYAQRFFFHGSIILHDQEPFQRRYLDTYRHFRHKTKNYFPSWLEMQDIQLLLQQIQTCSWPIFCHSEKNSVDIKWLESNGFLTCHYLWHGMISRDWFRHWKHHPDLQDFSESWQKRFLLYARGKDGTRQYRKTILEKLLKIKHQVHYDWAEEKNISSESSTIIDVADAKSSAVHIVAETVFDLDKIHVTEKIFKPMVMSQPFVVFGGAGTLEYLKSYGFQTFDSIWDESYDKEPDPQKRLEAVLSVIYDLSCMSDDQFRDTIKRCRTVIQHNRKHFFSEKFESTMIAELQTNVAAAIDQQKYLAKVDPGGSFFHIAGSMLKEGIELTPGMNLLIDFVKNHQSSRAQQIIDQHSWLKRWSNPNRR